MTYREAIQLSLAGWRQSEKVEHRADFSGEQLWERTLILQKSLMHSAVNHIEVECFGGQGVYYG